MNDTMTLYQLMETEIPLLDRLGEIESDLMENGGAFASEEQEAEYEALLDELARTEYEVAGTFDAYGFVMTELEQKIGALKGREEPLSEMVKNLHARRFACERRVSAMKERLLLYMQACGVEKVEGDHFRFRRQMNGGRDRVELTEEIEDVPEAFIENVPRLREDRLLAALSGELGPDLQAEAERVAKRAERGEHLRKY